MGTCVSKEVIQGESFSVLISPAEARLIEKALSMLTKKINNDLTCKEDGYEEERERDIAMIKNIVEKIGFI